jgi:Imidazolonepropionase and related amidohydrolases
VVDLQDRIGSIKAGKDADLLVFDTDPLAPHARPEQVWISGRRVG